MASGGLKVRGTCGVVARLRRRTVHAAEYPLQYSGRQQRGRTTGRRHASAHLGVGDQPDASLIREIRVRPLQQDAQPVPEPHEKHDVDEEPEPPREPTYDSEAPEVRDRLITANGRQIALVQVLERQRRLIA